MSSGPLRNGSHVCIIPARGGSKGIPRKNVIDFCGQPLIAWSIQQAQKASLISNVYVTTDDDEIASVAQRYGAKVIQRPAEYATDTASSEDALLHALSVISTMETVSTVTFLQATSPVRENNDVQAAIETMMSEGADCLFSGTRCDDFCIWTKDSAGALKGMTYDPMRRGRRQDKPALFLENGSIYVFKAEEFKKEKNRICGKIAFYPMQMWKSYEIDSAEDIELLEAIMRERVL